MRRANHVTAALLALLLASAADAQDIELGRTVYEKWCVACHGAEGKGDGPGAAYMLPQPRDFAQARYQIRTTGSGELPTDDDILAVIRDGLPGTTMPGWPNLSDAERRAVVAYIKSLSRFFEMGAPTALEFSSDPGGGEDALLSGREAYQALECFKCHGEAGRGDGASSPTLEDWRASPIRAADLTEAWYFNGGATATDIHTRVLSGLDGTPMPAATDAMAAGVVTEAQVWHLAHYVESLGESEMPALRDLVRVGRVEPGALPDGPNSEGWTGIDAFYFPLVGQIIEAPRLFSPTVDGVWIQAVHDGSELAMRVTWNDPSRSPDPAWDEWQQKLAATTPDDGYPRSTEPLADAVAVQFPEQISDDAELPYFLMGGDRAPVYLWRWDSQGGISEARAAGLGNAESLSGGSLAGAASYDSGRWQLQLRRSLDPGSGPGTVLRDGVAIPVAFFVWDGSSGETGKRAAVGSWYYLFLEQPASRAVIITPLLAVLITAGLGLALVRRAQSGVAG